MCILFFGLSGCVVIVISEWSLILYIYSIIAYNSRCHVSVFV